MKNEVKASALNVRITERMHNQLREAAVAQGRTVSQEVEFRLARSFSADPDLGGQKQALLLEDMAAVMNAASMTLAKPWYENFLGWQIVRNSWQHLLDLLQPDGPSDFETSLSPEGRAALERWTDETEPKRRAILDRQRELQQLRLKKAAFMLDRYEEMRLELLEILPESEAPSLPKLNARDLQTWHAAEEHRILGSRLCAGVAPILSQAKTRHGSDWEDDEI